MPKLKKKKKKKEDYWLLTSNVGTEIQNALTAAQD
jgi:hypothetical protein